MIKVQNVKNYSLRQTDDMKLRSNTHGCELKIHSIFNNTRAGKVDRNYKSNYFQA